MKLCTVLALASSTAAVFRDDVSVFDWKQTYIGTPLVVSEYNGRVAVVSDTQSLSCLNGDGTTTWRRTLSPDQLLSGVAFIEDVIVVGGSEITGFNATTGVPLWTNPLAASSVFAHENNVVVNNTALLNIFGEVVERLEEALDAQLPTFVSNTDPNGDLVNTEVALALGTLSWDAHGVMRLVSPNEEEIFVRDEGLAHIEDAIFVSTPFETDELALLRQSVISSPLELFVDRVTSHIGQVWSLVTYLLKNGPAMLVLPEKPNPEFELDQTLVVQTRQGSVYGLNATNSGAIAWVYHDLDAVSLVLDPKVRSQFFVTSKDGNTYTVTGSGDIIDVEETEKWDKSVENRKVPAKALEIRDNVVSSTEFGWTLRLPGDTIVDYAVRDPQEASGSVVVPAASGDVLYKYLQPFMAVFASHTASTNELALTVLDTVTGRVLASFVHADPVLVNEDWPLKLVFGEHWFACTYLSLDESQTMKITMVELFESALVNVRLSGSHTSLWNDTSVPYASMHTWVLPSRHQPVYSLAVSASPFGAGARELVLALAHQVVALPKAMLNTLKPAREVAVTRNGHLSHIYGVEEATQLVVGRTKSEFTYLVAAIGKYSDLFCSRVSPVGEVDRLSYSFPKVKLIVFVSVLTFICVTLSPLARNKVLKQHWR